MKPFFSSGVSALVSSTGQGVLQRVFHHVKSPAAPPVPPCPLQLHLMLFYVSYAPPPAPPTAASLPKDPAGRGLSFLGVGLSQFLCSALVGSDWFGSTRLFPLSSPDLFDAHVRSDAFGAEFQMIHTALGSCALTGFTWGVSESGWSSRLFG